MVSCKILCRFFHSSFHFKMSNLKIVADDDEFQSLLKGAGDDLVVIDFYTTWCRPCRTMEPVFEAMAIHYPKALFMKVDADKCFNTAMSYKVSGVPFFVIYFNKTVVETIQGANPQELELKIRLAEIESRKATAAMEQASNIAANNVNPVISTFGKLGCVSKYIDYDNCHCLNDLSPTSFHNFLGGKKLISGKGSGKILLVYSFTQKMMLQSFKIKATPGSGPKVLRFFVNHPKVLDFNVGSTLAPSQEVTLNHSDLQGDHAIELRSGSFQMVTNLQIFVTCGQAKNSRIEIDSIQLFGAPILAIQPLLTVVDSLLAPAIVAPQASNKQPAETTPSSTSGNQNTIQISDNSSRSCCSPSDTLGVNCTVSQVREDRASHQNRPRSLSNNNGNANGNNEQRPGHSKNLLQTRQSQQSTPHDKERRHHDKPNKGNRQRQQSAVSTHR